ncbi:MAG: ABC transporter permease [Coraliomargarita sp.]
MLLWIKLAWRNLLKNKRRSFFTLGAIALGFTAINQLGGFMLYVFRGLEESYVYTFEGGHLTVFKEGFQANGQLDPTGYFFDGAETDAVLALIGEIDGVRLATPRMQISGLLSNGDVSSIMLAEAKVAEDSRFMREQASGFVSELELFEGEDLANGDAYSIGVAHGLADKLKLEQGADVIAMANTLDGYMNALDAKVVQLQDAPLELLDEMLITVPFEFGQSLLDTEGADRIVVLLESGDDLERTQQGLEARLLASGFAVEVVNWKDLRVSYYRIRNMFRVIFAFVFTVMLLIVVLSIINTVSMAVVERTREIGTLRALGLKRRGVILLFAFESGLLGLCGLVTGAALHIASWLVVLCVRPTWTPPNIPKSVPWEIAWSPTILLVSAAMMLCLALVAGVLPARRASQMPVCDALGHT